MAEPELGERTVVVFTSAPRLVARVRDLVGEDGRVERAASVGALGARVRRGRRVDVLVLDERSRCAVSTLASVLRAWGGGRAPAIFVVSARAGRSRFGALPDAAQHVRVAVRAAPSRVARHLRTLDREADGAPRIPRRLLREIIRRWATEHDLTVMERRVAERILHGLSNKQIAATIGSALGTIRTHVANLLRKLGVGTRGELASLALRALGAAAFRLAAQERAARLAAEERLRAVEELQAVTRAASEALLLRCLATSGV